jgi:hypothetical protein
VTEATFGRRLERYAGLQSLEHILSRDWAALMLAQDAETGGDQ